MAITVYIMDDNGDWRLETVEDEIVCGPAYERAQEAAQEAAEDEDGHEDYDEWCNPHA